MVEYGVFRRTTLLHLALWFGLVAGFVDVVVTSAAWLFGATYILFSPHYVWMAPMADVAIFAAVAVALMLAGWIKPALVAPFWVVLVFAFLFFQSAIFPAGEVHFSARWILAAGLAVQAARVLSKHLDGLRTVMVWTTPLMVVLTLGLAAFNLAGPAIAERRQLSLLPGARAEAPNVVLLVLDTVRAENMSLYGYRQDTTPALRELARHAIVFDNAISPSPWTLPAHASMVTGHPPFDLSATWQIALDATYPTVSEAFQSDGYVTAGFVANPWYAGRPSGLNRGFAHYEDYPVTLNVALTTSSLGEVIFGGRVNTTNVLRRLVGEDQPFGRQSAERIRGNFTTWLDSRRDARPFFVFMNWFDAHWPYHPPEAFRRRFRQGVNERNRPDREVDAYDALLAYLDQQINMLMEDLERRHLMENTIIVITADHGEQFGEHGLQRHGNSLYRQLLHVPLMIVQPRSSVSGRRVEAPVSLTDLPATLMELAALDSTFPGVSLARFWNGASLAGEAPILSEVRKGINTAPDLPVSRGDMLSLVGFGLHFIRNGDAVEEIYSFDNDRAESFNLAGSPQAAPFVEQFRSLAAAIGAARR